MPNQAFSHLGFLRVVKREYLGGQKSSAPICDSGAFWAIFTERDSIDCEGLPESCLEQAVLRRGNFLFSKFWKGVISGPEQFPGEIPGMSRGTV